MPRVIRTGIPKHGARGLLIGYAMIALCVVPFPTLLKWGFQSASYLYPLVGVMGFMWMWRFTRGVRRTNARLSNTYLTARRHTEKLGLQATIRTDLGALLKG